MSSPGRSAASPPPPIHTSLALEPHAQSGTRSRSLRTIDQCFATGEGGFAGPHPVTLAQATASTTTKCARRSAVIAGVQWVRAASERVDAAAFAAAERIAVGVVFEASGDHHSQGFTGELFAARVDEADLEQVRDIHDRFLVVIGTEWDVGDARNVGEVRFGPAAGKRKHRDVARLLGDDSHRRGGPERGRDVNAAGVDVAGLGSDERDMAALRRRDERKRIAVGELDERPHVGNARQDLDARGRVAGERDLTRGWRRSRIGRRGAERAGAPDRHRRGPDDGARENSRTGSEARRSTGGYLASRLGGSAGGAGGYTRGSARYDNVSTTARTTWRAVDNRVRQRERGGSSV